MTDSRTRARDAGLARVSTITRWMLAAAGGVTAIFSVLAAGSFPGRPSAQAGSGTASSATSGSSSQTSSGSSSSSIASASKPATSSGSSSGSALLAPSSPLSSSAAAPTVVSGGS